ncbi:hypothetical protein J6590_028022 [Homalodisca vitripennis]|nr:hypothetical protein J6590_028022 [Homalodisca vitripennis]
MALALSIVNGNVQETHTPLATWALTDAGGNWRHRSPSIIAGFPACGNKAVPRGCRNPGSLEGLYSPSRLTRY